MGSELSFALGTRVVGALVAACLFAGTSAAQSVPAAVVQPASAASAATARSARAAASASVARAHKTSPIHTEKMNPRAKNYYVAAWGVDKLKVSYTSSGNLIRFTYRVSDPERAKILSDKRATPYMLGQRSRALLQVPVMDKVGALRQTAAPKAGQEYWMVFSNKGNLVKPGDRVNVMIGAFHADGLLVE